MKWLVFVNLIVLSQAQVSVRANSFLKEADLESVDTEPIPPYSFSYVADAVDGRSAREESSDGSGTVRGSYEISSAEGLKRVVNYVADKDGFRAQVQTNEPGTESKNPAFVQFESSQPPAEEIAIKYGPKPTDKFGESGLPHPTFVRELPRFVGFGNVRLAKVGLANVGPANVGLGNVELGNVGFGNVGLGNVGFGNVGLGGVGLGNVGLVNVGVGPFVAAKAFQRQRSSFETPVFKQLETPIPSFSHELSPPIQTNVKPVETPIKILTQFPVLKSSPVLSTNFKPLTIQQSVPFETQQGDEVLSRESF